MTGMFFQMSWNLEVFLLSLMQRFKIRRKGELNIKPAKSLSVVFSMDTCSAGKCVSNSTCEIMEERHQTAISQHKNQESKLNEFEMGHI